MTGCPNCGLPDPHDGEGDGIGTCECPREDCGCSPTDVVLTLCPHVLDGYDYEGDR